MRWARSRLVPEFRCGPAVAPSVHGSNLRDLQPIDEGCDVASAEPIIDIHYGDVGSAGVHHAEQGSKSLKCRAITDAGRNCDDGYGHQSPDHAGQGTFHTSADNYDAGFCEQFAVCEQAVNAGNPNIVEVFNF